MGKRLEFGCRGCGRKFSVRGLTLYLFWPTWASWRWHRFWCREEPNDKTL